MSSSMDVFVDRLRQSLTRYEKDFELERYPILNLLHEKTRQPRIHILLAAAAVAALIVIQIFGLSLISNLFAFVRRQEKSRIARSRRVDEPRLALSAALSTATPLLIAAFPSPLLHCAVLCVASPRSTSLSRLCDQRRLKMTLSGYEAKRSSAEADTRASGLQPLLLLTLSIPTASCPVLPQLTYWVSVGSMGLFESLFDKLLFWLPLYFIAKCCFIVWLQHPQTRGAQVMYENFLGPLFGTFTAELASARQQAKLRAQMVQQQAQQQM